MSDAARFGVVLGLGFLVACSAVGSGEGEDGSRGVVPVVATTTGPLGTAFAASAAGAGVPRDLLVAIAKVEDGLTMPAERPDLDVDNEVPAAGPLQLRRGKLDTLRRGAELVAKTELELRQHADLALEAGALVLAELGAKTHARTGDLASWADAIGEMSGFADRPHRESYVHQVFATLARGGSFVGRDGEVVQLQPHDLPPSLTLDISDRLHTLANAQFPNTEWIPTSCTNKCTPTRAGNAVEMVIIHDTEGGWNASVATLQNDPNKSAHYIIGEDGRLAQFVTEETTAWHGGNFHYNQRSIGIEHVGYATKPFPEPLYAASAKLVDHLLTKYKIPRDRAHVIGHDQIPNGTRIAQSSPPCSGSPKQCQGNLNYGGASHHTDPGIWEWAVYMSRINGTAKCNDATAIWNCSNDKKHAFRCTDGKVQVESCSACEVKPNGVDDVCTVAAKVEPAPPPGETAPASTSTTPDSETTPSTKSDPDEEADEAEEEETKGARTETPNASAGCSAATSSGTSPFALAGLVLGLSAVLARRRRGR